MNKTIETENGIPGAENVDMAVSPVSQAEMDAELKRMNEAVSEAVESSTEKNPEDLARIEEVRQSLIEEPSSQMEDSVEDGAGLIMSGNIDVPPEEPRDNEGGGDGDGKGEEQEQAKEYRRIHESQTHYEYDICPNCGGSGRKFFIFPCSVCGGTGNVLASKDTTSSSRDVEIPSAQAENKNKKLLPENSGDSENPERKQE